jgi:glycosyltransferase involved in cell wall biosynthesis
MENSLRTKINCLYKKWLERPAEEEAILSYSNSITEGNLSLEGLEVELQRCEERKNLINNRNMIKKFIPQVKNVRQFDRLIKGDSCKGLKIRYYGPVGKTGYCQAAKAYFYALFENGAELTFEPLQYHSFNNEYRPSEVDLVLYNHIGRQVDYNTVIIHSVPDGSWQRWVDAERMVNKNVRIVGLTVWETDKIHPTWVKYMNMVDYVITPCDWNREVFTKQISVPVFTVHNPIVQLAPPDNSFKTPFNEAVFGGWDEKMVFYTITEWTARKGIEDLIDCFLATFTEDDNTCLYIKTSTISQRDAELYIESKRSKFEKPPVIHVNTSDVSDNQISTIHKRGSIYVSLCKSEGTGLGACEATLWGNPVIITGFGGQLDYLKGAFYISCSTEAPNMCNSIQKGHQRCSEDRCNIYPWYSKDQNW